MAEAHQDEIAKLEALYASNPEGRVFTHLAEAYRKAGERDRAHQILTDGLRRHPGSASAYVVLGRVLADGGDSEASITAFRQALDLDAGNLVALRWLGDLTVRVGRVDEAIGFYHELIARDPSDINLLDRVAVLEADRAAAMSAPPATDHPAESVELAPDIESPAGIRAAGDLADLEALAAQGPGDDAIRDPSPSGDVLAALAAADHRADPLESLAYAPEPAIGFEDVQDEDVQDADEEAGFEISDVIELSMDDAQTIDDADIFTDEIVDLSARDATDASAYSAYPDEPLVHDTDLSTDTLDVGGFGDAVGGEAPAISAAMAETAGPSGVRAPVTETMAELYRNQGFPERAAEVYRQLLRERGGDARLERLLAEIDLEQGGVGDADADPVFQQDAAGELWLQDVESPWVDADGGAPQHDSPYAWGAEAVEEAGSNAPGIGTYFASLLGWRPRSVDDAILLLDDDAEAYVQASRFMDAQMDAGEEEATRASGEPADSEADYDSAATGRGPEPAVADREADIVLDSELDSELGGADGFADVSRDPWEGAAEDVIATEDGLDPGSFDPGFIEAEEEAAADAPAGDPWSADLQDDATGYAFGSEDAEAPMPWETAPSSFGPPAAHAEPEVMPWEVPVHESTSGSNGAPEPAETDLMPWETSPAAALSPPESRTPPDEPLPPWSAADEKIAGSTGGGLSDWSQVPAGGSHHAGDQGQASEDLEDDEDLEMFRSWLQSLKK